MNNKEGAAKMKEDNTNSSICVDLFFKIARRIDIVTEVNIYVLRQNFYLH